MNKHEQGYWYKKGRKEAFAEVLRDLKGDAFKWIENKIDEESQLEEMYKKLATKGKTK